MTDIHLIYAGGTFGSHGVPLSPLPANVFLPVLTTLLNERLTTNQHVLTNHIIKDSSTLTPVDFVHFYELILTAYQAGNRRFVLLTGTDTLAFLSAFLFHAFASFDDISLVITGSMQPLLIADSPAHQINDNSDAWHNLSEAIQTASTHTGVFVQFFGQTFWADNTQKIHSQAPNAFVGTPINQPRPHATHTRHLDTKTLHTRALMTNIQAIYALPTHSDNIVSTLNNSHATAIILIAFGAGNLAKTDDMVTTLDKLHKNNIPIVCTSMCAFGGVTADYQAGSWQYDHHVWSGGKLGVAGIYGKLLWQCLTHTLDGNTWGNT